MARIKYSGLIHDISGSIGGTTFQANAYGATVRNKPKNNASQSLRQNLSRSYVSQVAAAWAALTPSEQSVWDRCQTFFNIKAWNNKSSLLYGRAVFFKYNLTRLQAGLDILDVPSFTTIPYIEYIIAQSVTGGRIALSVVPDLLTNNQYMLLSVSRGVVSGSINQPANNRVCRLIYVSDCFYDFTADYLANYGAIPLYPDNCININYNVLSTIAPVILPMQSTQLIGAAPGWDDTDIWDDADTWPA